MRKYIYANNSALLLDLSSNSTIVNVWDPRANTSPAEGLCSWFSQSNHISGFEDVFIIYGKADIIHLKLSLLVS